MRRTRLPRGTEPLARRKELKASPESVAAFVERGRASELPKRNRDRQKRRQDAGLVKGEHHRWIAKQPCVLAGLPGHRCGFTEDQPKVCGHHIKTIGSGGEDRNNELPVCALAHIEFHQAGDIRRMCDRYGRDFRSMACEFTAAFDRAQPSEVKR